MEFISPAVISIVKSFLVPIKKHLGFLVSSTKYVKDMKMKMGQLNLTEQDIQGRKKTADAHNYEVSIHVSSWLEDVKKMKEKVESIPTGGIGCFSPLKRYKVGKKSYALLEQTKALKERESEIIWTDQEIPLARVPSTFTPVSSGTQNNFESRDLVFRNALKALQSTNESEKMIALCGMGGVGKTTMMEQLLKVVKDSKMFDWVVKVVLGEEADPISLQRAIAKYTGKDLTETTKDARSDRLLERFMGMSEDGKKKVLIIMDDVWKKVKLKDVGLYPLQNGFKILLTSRFEDVCTQMGVKTHSIFDIPVLKDVEAKKLFFDNVELSQVNGDDPEIERIGEDILKKCGGLPIAIITIANLLSGNIKEAWKKTLSNLQKHDLRNLHEIVHSIFEMSYENLETEEDKRVFLLSGLFTEDFNIPVEDLMMYGWGLNLFPEERTLAEARMQANISVNNLLRANLLTKSESMGCVKLHDLVRSFILSNFTEVKQASIVNHDSMSGTRHIEDTHNFYERIMLKCTGMSEFPVEFTNHDNLSLLIIMDGNTSLKFPKDSHKRMEKLKVVSYENMSISLLSETFIHSTKLRTLCLRSCSLVNEDIYHIGSLSNLETLSFAGCKVSMLPSTIGKLKNLKSLDLTGCVDLCIEDGIFENLKSLGELYMRASPGQPIRFTDANCKELEKLSERLIALELEFFENKVHPKHVSFRNLERFRISIGCELKETEKYSFRNTLRLITDCGELKECNISDLFKKTEELHLQVNDMYHLQGLSMHHSFFNLRDLHVSKCANLTYLFTYVVASGLKKLERLTVSQCSVLRTLVGEKLGVIKFPKLSLLSLNGLPKMVSLCDDVIELPELVELRVIGLKSIMSIYSNDNNNNICAMQTLLNKEVVIPKLEKLRIISMGNLKQIWPCEISNAEKNNVSMLKMITIRYCDSLVNIFPSDPLPLLNHLEKIRVEKCGSVEVLFNIDFEHVCEMEGYSSRLRSIKIDQLGKLKEVWRIGGVNNSDIHINVFKSVETIRISGCGSFTNLFTPTITNFDLGSLTTYRTVRIGEQIDHGISKREITEMHNLTYPSYLLHTCYHLQDLYLESDRRVGEVMFEMDSTPGSGTQSPTTIQPPLLLLPYLENLELDDLKETSHVWKCNWNAFMIPQHQPEQFPFQNLANISLFSCHKIQYLISPLLAKYLSNLKKVWVHSCYGIKEVISGRDGEYEESTTTSSNTKTTFFPRLETLGLQHLPCLKSVDGFQSIRAFWSFCQYPRKIYIKDCNTLASLVPWYAAGQMKKLEDLTIESCKRMTEVFESDSISYNTNDVDKGSASNVTAGAMLISPTLKSITNVVAPQLSNLKSVTISNCDLLQHIFTFSTLESLKQLKELEVKNCSEIQMIVKEEKEVSSKVVVFSHLETLKLRRLPDLKGFFLGVNDFHWPSLHDVMIDDCPRLMMLTGGKSKAQKLKYIHTGLGKYNAESCGLNFQAAFPTSSDVTKSKEISWSYHNLLEVNMEYYYYGPFIIPSHALLQLKKLEKITCKSCYKVERVFDVELEETNNNGLTESRIPIVTIPNLTKVEIDRAYDLKYLCKSTQWMVLEFPNLTTLNICRCDKLEHVFTCSMVASLVQLQDLHMRDCENIEVIVKEEKEECEAKVHRIIMLPRLKSLKLENHSSLKGFCIGNDAFSFPDLGTLEIKGCPKITIFTKGHPTTPELKVIDTSFGLYYVGGDINSFINTKQEEGYKF